MQQWSTVAQCRCHVTVQISSLCLYMRACTNTDCSTLPNKQHDVSPCSHKVTQPWITQSQWYNVNRQQENMCSILMLWSSERQDWVPSCPSSELIAFTCHSRCKSVHDQTAGLQDKPSSNAHTKQGLWCSNVTN